MKYFDYKNGKLVFVEQKATSSFWDHQWLNSTNLNSVITAPYNPRKKYHQITKKYLNKNDRVIEGGCGNGAFTYQLRKEGFDAMGVDFAADTIRAIKNSGVSLPVKVADVRELPFKDNYFDGYWSLGVIEHFYDGYDEIMTEMYRVIRKGGYLFLTFPQLSLIRKIKIRLKMYHEWQLSEHIDFYQYAYDYREVVGKFEADGFELVEKHNIDGFKGLKNESDFISKTLSPVYRSQNFLFVAFRYVINFIFTPLSAHTCLLVLKKKN